MLSGKIQTELARQSLTNIARYANATEASVEFTKEAGKMILEVRDNGVGITTSQISDSKSFGLIGMHERAYVLGGDVEIKGVKGINGSCLICRNSVRHLKS